MNELPENSNGTGATELETLDYLRGVKSSTCLLLSTTPSPTPIEPNDFKHPLSEEMSEGPFLALNSEPIASMQNIEASTGDTSSSGDSNSVVQDPVSAQLINNISMLDYQTLSKNGDIIMGETEDCKLSGNLKINNRKLPHFVNWNWPFIRKGLLWIVLSGLVACLGAIIAMVFTIPKECNPDLPWYQGKVFYEVFHDNFKDSNNYGASDFQGLIKKLDDIQGLGASTIRLNNIFDVENYLEHQHNLFDLEKIHSRFGDIKDFQDLVAVLHSKKMFIILDIPVLSMTNPILFLKNSTHMTSITNNTMIDIDPTSSAIDYWARKQNVDGFYLKNLEKFVHDGNFTKTLQIWKQIIGNDKIFIASEKAYNNAKDSSLNVLLSRIDLIDVHLNLYQGIIDLKKHIDDVITGNLYEKPYYSWVHWNIGNINIERTSTKHINNSLVLTSLGFVLPGTVSIFYGDEIEHESLPKNNSEKDFHNHEHLHNSVPVTFSNKANTENSVGILAMNSESGETKFHFLEIIKSLTKFRLNTPTIYSRAIYKEGNIFKNTEIRKTEENLVVIERWYPRRNTCVFVGNLSNKSITTDLSSMFYGGTVVAGTDLSLVGQVLYFDQVTFPPNSALILKLEK